MKKHDEELHHALATRPIIQSSHTPIKTAPKIEDRNNIRHYICTHFFKFPNSAVPGNEGYVENFLEKLLESVKPVKNEIETDLEVAKKHGNDIDINYLDGRVLISNQSIAGIQAIINGEKRAVFQDCKDYLVDIFRQEDIIAFRLYMARHASYDDSAFSSMIRLFRKESGAMMGHSYFIAVEDDFDFSDW